MHNLPFQLTSGGKLFTIPTTVYEDGVEYEVREVYKERKGVAVAVRVDGKHPLAQREEKGYLGNSVFREMLIGGFRPAQKQEGMSYTGATQRVTENANNRKQPAVGEEVKDKATVEDLIFRFSDEEGAEAPEKEKGVVEVIVFEVTEDEVMEVVKTPVSRASIIKPFGNFDDWFGVRGGTKTFSGGFKTGETKFGKPKHEKVSISGIRDLKPLAAFRMVLVGEKPQDGLEMKEAPNNANASTSQTPSATS